MAVVPVAPGVALKIDLYRRVDGALVVVPARFASPLPSAGGVSLRFVRTVEIELGLLGDGLVLDIGLQGHAVADGADAALLRSRPSIGLEAASS